MALGSNLHRTPRTAVPFLWRCPEEIERQALRSADQNHADDAHDIRDGFPGREVRLDHRRVREMHPHGGSLVHALSLERLELSLRARLELRVALRDSLFPLQNLRNQPRILRRIGCTRTAGRAGRAGGVGGEGRGVRDIGQMHHLGLHVRSEIARIHSVLAAKHHQIALRNLALELLHPHLQLLHAFLRLLRSTKASGLILANSITQERLESLSREIVTVTCCEAVPDSNVPYVTIDDEGASYNAVRYLISLGRRGIAFINGPRSFKYAREREKGYLEALHESGFEAEHRYMAEVGEDMDFETARAIATHMLNYPDRPDAFFCVSDIIACAVEKAALQLSLRIPEDIAIVGFDDIMASHMANPSITTVRQPTVQMGALSTEMVIKLIEKDENSIKSVILGTELVIRESTTV